MKEYIVRRILLIIPVVIGVSLLVFFMIHLIPGDPAAIILGDSAQPADIEQLRKDLGLDRPLHIQLALFLEGLARLDLGKSLHRNVPVIQILRERFPSTIELAVVSLLIAVLIAFPLGIISAIKSRTSVDSGAMFFALLGVSIPHFWLGPMLILVFSIYMRWLPVSGKMTWASYILPALTLGTSLAAFLTRMIRSSLLDVIRAPYIATARAKGLSHGRVIIKHAMRNALIPVVTILGLQLGALLGGSIITETIFSWPGVGRELIQAIQGRDYPVVQGCVLIISLAYVVINLLTDILYSIIDPRIQYSTARRINSPAGRLISLKKLLNRSIILLSLLVLVFVSGDLAQTIGRFIGKLKLYCSESVQLFQISGYILKFVILIIPVWMLFEWRRYDRKRFKKFFRRTPSILGLLIFFSFLFLGLFGSELISYDPLDQNLAGRLQMPCRDHIFGTDDFGREMSGRMVHGAFISMYVGVTTTLFCAVIGVFIGLISALSGGWVDEMIMRLIDILLAFPGILLAIAMVAVLGPSINNVIIALSLMGWVGYARLSRAQVLSIREEDYISAARSVGVTSWRMMLHHLLPNILAPLIVQATLGMASVIVAEAGLSFLGLGVQPPTPSWGSILNSGIDFFRKGPHMTIIPGLAVMIVVLGLNFLGDGLRDALDPKMPD